MKHADPSAGVLILPANENAAYRRLSTQLSHSDAGADGWLAYIRLIVRRCSQCLLEPFGCVVWGAMALDPMCWNGPGQPLCGGCADPPRGPACTPTLPGGR